MTEATHFRYSAGDEPIEGYVLVELLGRGASGSVWKAQGPGKTIALKIVDLKQKIGQKELRALKRVKDINHPNLVPIFAFWLKDAAGRTIDHDKLLDQLTDESSASGPRAIQLIIAMGLGESTLGDHLRVRRKSGEQGIVRNELLDYMDAAARAIDHLNLHHDIQHGDVKPTNILLVGGGVQVCDFGLASTVRDDMRQTSAGYSPAYAAPELIADDIPTSRSDQYSLAITFVELLTGRLPFPVEAEQLYDAKTQGQIRLEGLGEVERRTIRKATALDPSKRFETCTAMVKSLRQTGSDTDELTSYRFEYEAGDIPVPGYKLVEALGIGGAGQVWRATRAGVEVALKIVNLDRNIGQKELEALRLVKEFKHPNLIPIHGFWLRDDAGTLRDGSQVDLASPSSAPTQQTTSSVAMDKTVDLSTPPADGTVDVSGGNVDLFQTTNEAAHIAKPEVTAPRSTQLIIAMGLGDATLADRLTECDEQELPGIPRKEVLEYLRDAAEAIDLLNEKGIQHCDIKPTNILMVGRGEDVRGGVQVCDFGLAQAVGGDHSKSSPAYSPPYAAPELMQGEGPSATTDQFSLAITYVELLTNDLPYPSGSLKKLKAAKLAGEIDLSKLSGRDRRVVRRACSLDPAERYRNTRQMVAALQRRNQTLPIAIELLMILALTAFFFYPNDDGPTLKKINTHVKERDFRTAWIRTGDLEDDTSRAEARQDVVDAWQSSILSTSLGQVDVQTDKIHDDCNQLLGVESDHPRAALASAEIFVLRARARVRLEQWDEALLDLDRASPQIDQLETADPALIHYHLLTIVDRTRDPATNGQLIGDDDALLARIEAVAEARPKLASEHWEKWDTTQFEQVIKAIIAFAENVDETTPAFAKLSGVISRLTGAPADRDIRLRRVARYAEGGSPAEIERCESILAELTAEHTDDESQQLIEQHRCLVRVSDPETPWAAALDALEKLGTQAPSLEDSDDDEWLLEAVAERLRRQALINPQAIEYPTLHRHCKLYRARDPEDVATNACWLESAIELQLSSGQEMPSDSLSILQSLTEQLPQLSQDQRAFCLYVRSLVLFHNRDSQDTSSDLLPVAVRDANDWLTPHRRQRMTEMLLGWSAGLIGENLTSSADANDFFLSQPSAAAAEQASQLSAAAYQLAGAGGRNERFPQLIRIRALATYYDGTIRGGNEPWDAEVIRLLNEYEQLQGKLDGKLNLVGALSYARRNSDADKQQSLRSFATVLQSWFDSMETPVSRDQENPRGRIRYDANKPSVRICRQVIEPALHVADLPEINTSQLKLPHKLPKIETPVASEVASILALKGYLLLTDHDVRRYYESSATPEESGGATQEAFVAYLFANELEPGNQQHLFGLGLAFHALPDVSQTDKIQGLNWVVQQADQHGFSSPKLHGLRGFVNALQARNSVLLADKARFYGAARRNFRQALRTKSQLSEPDRLIFEPSYLVSLSSVDLELAFVREKRGRRRVQARELLREAVRVADLATKTNWASAPELPWISKGNAQEDLELYVRDGEQNYVKSIESFTTARNIAFHHWRSTKLATLSRERCRFRLVANDPDETTVRKIARDLSKAHMGNHALDWEIMFWVGRAYRLLAERQANPDDIRLAREAFQQASDSAKGKTHDWPVYNIGWAEFELGQGNKDRAMALATEVIKLGVENVRDDIFLRAIPIAFQGQPAKQVAAKIEDYLSKTEGRPFIQAELRLMRAPLWVKAARDDTDQAERYLRVAYQDCKAVRDWSQRDLARMPESETHFRARADAWIGGIMSNYDFLELLDDEDRQPTIERLKTNLDRAIRDLIPEDRPSSSEALLTAGGVWQYFFDETHPALK